MACSLARPCLLPTPPCRRFPYRCTSSCHRNAMAALADRLHRGCISGNQLLRTII